ncbi:hypothetical protein B0A55_00649 [Friedmanniomyces simplex]|uniref:Zn(2)-C6 fungal-type domain-containing protein n=1 Tax=Friedmanniomyces simplex TaxID=329884 RepID=A0A4U0XYU8_9PEZI|nr:hypothetical protein B0A55_00649 [Friedmanniomyces simplex]
MSSSGKKRVRQHDDDTQPDSTLLAESGTPPAAASTSTTNFRSVSACNRCRTRKNRCDQRLPQCTTCERAQVKCVGFDPVSKRAIPRNYVYYLETRVTNLEALLHAHGIACPPPSDDFAISDAIILAVPFPPQEGHARVADGSPEADSALLDPALQDAGDGQKLGKLANNVGKVAVRETSNPRQVAQHTTGIPFARVVYAAVKSSVTPTPAKRGPTKPPNALSSATASGGGGSDSFFGLNTKPTVKPAPFPDSQVGQRLVELYFEHANPQIPILHRGEFMKLVQRVYATDAKKRGPRELYLLNIVFAIGSGIIMDSSNVAPESTPDEAAAAPNRKRQRLASQQYQPEEYHSAAIVHLESFLGSPPAAEGVSGGLEELQAVLLLAGLGLLRPVAPGLWYIIGVAVRLAVDLGLHSEDMDAELDRQAASVGQSEPSSSSVSRRQWIRDLRRRLWWCTYSLDRLVSTCVGRPFGISDQVVTTEFPSLLDDKYITPTALLRPPGDIELPTYKLVAHHYFRLRLLQSEILQVLQHRQTEQVRLMGANRHNEYIHTDLPSPFVIHFLSFRDWRVDVDRRLREWKESAPDQASTGVAFTPLFLELNYWQAVVMLYRQSLTVPEPLAGELSPSTGGEVQSPGAASLEPKEDEEMVFMKVAQAGQTVLKIYRQLHRLKLVNYTFLATHHLFMSISFLYAIWHSTLVRSQLTLDDVDFTVLVATSVLTDLIDKCPPAEACRDAFTRMSKATISMVIGTTGFGNASTLGSQSLSSPGSYFRSLSLTQPSTVDAQPVEQERMMTRQAKMPQFDMNLRDLFSDDELANRPPVYHPERQAFGNHQSRDEAGESSIAVLLPPGIKTEASTFSILSPQGSGDSSHYHPHFQQPAAPTYQVPHQQPYQPLAEMPSGAQPDFAFDDLSFLDSLPGADPSNAWTGANDLFGTGGGGLDGNGAWEANGGVDLFDGFWFGPQ